VAAVNHHTQQTILLLQAVAVAVLTVLVAVLVGY
jgi:hypothetical protein